MFFLGPGYTSIGHVTYGTGSLFVASAIADFPDHQPVDFKFLYNAIIMYKAWTFFSLFPVLIVMLLVLDLILHKGQVAVSLVWLTLVCEKTHFKDFFAVCSTIFFLSNAMSKNF